MKVRLLCLGLLVSTLAVSVQGKPHGEHGSFFKQTEPSPERDMKIRASDEEHGAILPTLFPFEASSPDPEDGDMSEEQSDGGIIDVSEGGQRSTPTPVLLSEEALAQLLQGSVEEEQKAVDKQEDEDEGEGGEVQERKKESTLENKESKKEDEEREETNEEQEDLGSSTDLEIALNLDYIAESEAADPLPTKLAETEPSTSKAAEEEKMERELPIAMEDYDSLQSSQKSPNPNPKEENEKEQDSHAISKGNDEKEQTLDMESDKIDTDTTKETESKENELQDENIMHMVKHRHSDGKEEVEDTKGRGSHGKGKKQKRVKKQRKMQSDQAPLTEMPTESSKSHELEKDPQSLTTVEQQKNKRRKHGKWAPLIGMNPVQTRATVDLYPRSRPTPRPRPGPDGQEAPPDPCENFRCKRGKTCKLDEENKPGCVCQKPSECLRSFNEFEHVCGTDNRTYETSCQLFATKCGLEGTKEGHRLHLDYTGSCKFIPPCLTAELVQFPLRMRDWLKNVLLQLYEHDSLAPGFLTAKQRAKVQKLYESERRLHAGDHPIELLAQDFEKNYNMYIYPVHWQFAQMDQHPSDRFLSHSELAPLRVPLVPMEHCTSVFFHECDADKDKLVSFKEWCQCFGIKDEDMDPKLLF